VIFYFIPDKVWDNTIKGTTTASFTSFLIHLYLFFTYSRGYNIVLVVYEEWEIRA
jgi:hypothetical protein